MQVLKVGIIGLGRSGRNIHAHALELMKDRYAVAAVADPLEDRRAGAVTDFGCEAFADAGQMLAKRQDLDLVVNAAPSHLHVPLTEQVLRAGFHVLCDKPFGRRVADVDRLIELAARRGRRLAIFQQSRFAPYFQQVREVVASGVLGRIVLVKIFFNGFARRWDWQTLRRFDGGNLLNTGPHPLDQALEFIGRDALPEVICTMDRLNVSGDAEDHVKLILRRAGRPMIDLEISSCNHFNPCIYQVYGSCGSLAGTMNHLDWKYFKPEENPQPGLIEGPMPGLAYCAEQVQWHEGAWDAPEEAVKNLFDYMATRFYTNLHDVLVSGAQLDVTPEQVRQQIAVIEEAHRQNGSYRKRRGKRS